MKKLSIVYLFLLVTLLSSCELIGGIFKAGVWSGIIMVVLVIALVIFIVSKLIKGRK
jgi:uncharacterized membrane protein YtjA (UPF0391 family)